MGSFLWQVPLPLCFPINRFLWTVLSFPSIYQALSKKRMTVIAQVLAVKAQGQSITGRNVWIWTEHTDPKGEYEEKGVQEMQKTKTSSVGTSFPALAVALPHALLFLPALYHNPPFMGEACPLLRHSGWGKTRDFRICPHQWLRFQDSWGFPKAEFVSGLSFSSKMERIERTGALVWRPHVSVALASSGPAGSLAHQPAALVLPRQS